jgi:hypothetical protein
MDPDTNKLFVELVNMPETTKILDHLDIQAQKMAAAQQQQLEMQQQATAAQAQQKDQYDAQAEEHKTMLEIEKRKAEIAAQLAADIQLETAKAGLEAQQNEDYAMVDLGKQHLMNTLQPESGAVTKNEGTI